MPHEIVVGDEAAIVPRLAEVDILVSLSFTRTMAVAPRLKLVQVPGAGLDRIDRAALPPCVALANAYGHEVGIAEYVIGAMLALSRDFGRLDAQLREGVWESQWAVGTPAPPLWPELAGKTLGILGYGRIGQAVARRARAFGMAIRAIRRHPARSATEDGIQVDGPEALDAVLAQADHLAITLALSSETRGLIGARELGMMKPSAFLINVARAEVVEQAALYHALADRRLAGAALDVWYRYPVAAGATCPSDAPFHELANVLMTPHVSGWTEGMLEARSRLIADNAARLLAGAPLLNLVP
jgi:phosphoglycerate dehydrogenase-like enzyme